MTTACYREPQRRGTRADDVIEAFAEGCGGRVVSNGQLDRKATDHAIIGTWSVAQRLIPIVEEAGIPYWHLDSCFIRPASEDRYYRMTRNGTRPRLDLGVSLERALSMGIELRPWRTEGDHILALRQGPSSGKPWRTAPNAWTDSKTKALAKHTDRPVRIREKWHRYETPLAVDLENAWVVVTHSSTAAVAAVIAGIPVLCSRLNAAWMVGFDDLARIEAPPMPAREPWLAALAWCQFTIPELRAGLWKDAA